MSTFSECLFQSDNMPEPRPQAERSLSQMGGLIGNDEPVCLWLWRRCETLLLRPCFFQETAPAPPEAPPRQNIYLRSVRFHVNHWAQTEHIVFVRSYLNAESEDEEEEDGAGETTK